MIRGIFMTEKKNVTVDLSDEIRAPGYLAAGFLHGLSEDCSKPGAEYFDVLKPKNFRGANLGGFWLDGDLDKNLDLLKVYYDYLNPRGITIDYLLMDVWGFWYGNYFLNMPIRFPGDDGDWEDYEEFCKSIAAYVKENGFTNFQYNLWNEPNLVQWGKSQFWPRPYEQFLEMWKRGYRVIKSVHPDAVISGPDYALYSHNKDWKTDISEFLEFCVEHLVVPEVLTIHALPGDPDELVAFARKELDGRGLESVSIYVNEYAEGHEQTPGNAAWYVARIERAGVRGGRSIWPRTHTLENAPLWNVSGELNGLMYLDEDLNLYPTGIWWVYKRYADITGKLINTTPTEGNGVAAVAGIDKPDGKARILLGAIGAENVGNVGVEIKGFNNTGFLVKDGKVKATIEKISHNDGKPVEIPEEVLDEYLTIEADKLEINLDWGNASNAYAITLTG
jgi:hypothetical protein